MLTTMSMVGVRRSLAGLAGCLSLSLACYERMSAESQDTSGTGEIPLMTAGASSSSSAGTSSSESESQTAQTESGELSTSSDAGGSTDSGAATFSTSDAASTEPGSSVGSEDGTGSEESTGSSESTTGSGESTTGGSTSTGDLDSSTGDAGSSSSGEQSCDEFGGECLLRAPDGWSGPLALSDLGGVCGGAYPVRVGSAFGDFEPGRFECACDCEPRVSSFRCSAVRGGIHAEDDPSCTDTPWLGDFSVEPGECQQVQLSGGGSAHIRSERSELLAGADCDAQAAHILEPGTWGTESVHCASRDEFPGLDCESGASCVAVPDGPGQRACIVRDGEHACPPGPWSERRVRHAREVEDTRRCSSCRCGGGEANCGGRLVFGGSSCPLDVDDASLVVGLDGCDEHASSLPRSINVQFDVQIADLECDVIGGDATGQEVLRGTQTFCCASL